MELCCAPSTRPVVSVWQSCGARAVDAFPNGGAFRGLVLSLFLEEAPAGRECFASSGKQFLHVSFRRNLAAVKQTFQLLVVLGCMLPRIAIREGC